jgi:hypothetical protein
MILLFQFDYAKEFGGREDTQDKGQVKKLWKASFGQPIFFNGRSTPLAGEPPPPSLHGS